jgi:hypothetical protein
LPVDLNARNLHTGGSIAFVARVRSAFLKVDGRRIKRLNRFNCCILTLITAATAERFLVRGRHVCGALETSTATYYDPISEREVF